MFKPLNMALGGTYNVGQLVVCENERGGGINANLSLNRSLSSVVGCVLFGNCHCASCGPQLSSDKRVWGYKGVVCPCVAGARPGSRPPCNAHGEVNKGHHLP